MHRLARILGLLALTLSFGLLAAGSAGATTTATNSAAMTIPAGAPGTTTGAATPYPENVTVTGVPGTITKVTAKLNGLSHTFPGDLDVLLVSPGGQKVILMSDAGGGTDVTGVNYTFDDAAASSMSVGANPTGTYKPSNFVGVAPEPDTFAAPAPAGPYSSTMAAFNTGNPNGTWSLYVVDDASGDSGAISGGWTLNVTTTATAALSIPGTGTGPGPASPYPLTTTVSGRTGTISKVTATMTGLTHSFPDDIDALLVGPGGQKVMLMSDAGGGADLSNVNLTFDDAAAALLPDEAQIVGGTFRPSNFVGAACPTELNDALPTPAPAGPYGSALSAFNGTNPNGTWSLYLMDDCDSEAGGLNGFSLNITTALPTAPAPAATVDKTAPVASVSVPKQKLGKVAKSGKLVENVTTNEAGAISAQGVLAAKLAKTLGLPANGTVFTSAKKKAKPAIIAKGSAKASKAGKYKVTLKLTKKARKKLAKLKKVKLTLKTRVSDLAGNRRLVTKSVTLKR
jgi:subtilisin-like proprotein convertase family protein